MSSVRISALLAVWMFLTVGSAAQSGGAPARPGCAECDRKMRKVFEALQAWRRTHDGHYPDRMLDLVRAGLLRPEQIKCPLVRRESRHADAAHDQATSRKENGDPTDSYEYELTTAVSKSTADRLYLPDDAPPYTRQDLKVNLLRRDFAGQVPVLRCKSHRGEAEPAGEGEIRDWRNMPVTGRVYWSPLYWEAMWLDTVPLPQRDAIVLFGLEGPPFSVPVAPEVPDALDLRPWANAFGDVAWWWPFPMFEEGGNRQHSAALAAFFGSAHGRAATVGQESWWLNGLVQLQGRRLPDRQDSYRGFGELCFPWQRRGLPIGRKIAGARWLQGTVWEGHRGETAGWLVWHYADGSTIRVGMEYGRTTARFWADDYQQRDENGFPAPAWSRHESAEDTGGPERVLRLYRQEWRNERPDVDVVSLDFEANPECVAAPFLVSAVLLPAGGAAP